MVLLLWLLPMLVVAATLVTPVAWMWKASIWACTMLILVLARRAQASARRVASLRVYPNGTLTMIFGDGTEKRGSVGRGAWATRHLCVLPVTGMPGGLVVCASRNHADDYRRLLVWVKFQPWASMEEPGQ